MWSAHPTTFFFKWTVKIYSLNNFQIYNIINHSYHAIHYITRCSLFYNWKFVPFDHLHSFCPHLNPYCLWQSPICFLFIWIFVFFQIPHISEIIQYLSFSVWLTLLSVMPWSFIHSVPNSRISFFFIDEKYYILHIIFSST